MTEEKLLIKDHSHAFTLKKGEEYGFYCHLRLYGIYRLRQENSKYYFLSKNSFRPLNLHRDKSARETFLSYPEQIEMAWVNRNRIQDHLLMIGGEDEKKYFFKFQHHLLPGFEKTLTIEKTSETGDILTRIEGLLNNQDPIPLSELQSLGSRLFELGGFSQITPLLSRRITYSPPPSVFPTFPIEVLYDHKNTGSNISGWVWRENPILYFRQPSPVRRRLHRFISISTGEDIFMEKETEAIGRSFRLKKYFSTQFLLANYRETLVEILKQTIGEDILHLTAHGSRIEDGGFQFTYKGEPLLTLSDISRLPRTPSLVFLSNCYSDHPRLREVFFEKGTQTLITSQGPLFSPNLAEAIGGFYRRLLIEKMTVVESYHLLIRRLIQLNDIDAIKFRIHGYGRERLHSFK